jgi:hypothetical protein
VSRSPSVPSAIVVVIVIIMSHHWFRSAAARNSRRNSLRDVLPTSASTAAAAVAAVAAFGYQLSPWSPDRKQHDVPCNSSSSSIRFNNIALCDSSPPTTQPTANDADNVVPNQTTSGTRPGPTSSEMSHIHPLSKHRRHPHVGMKDDEPGEYHGLFPKRQLWQPKVPYPLWDRNWDGRDLASTGDKEADRDQARFVRKHGVTRHIILVRHGQYDEDEKVRVAMKTCETLFNGLCFTMC